MQTLLRKLSVFIRRIYFPTFLGFLWLTILVFFAKFKFFQGALFFDSGFVIFIIGLIQFITLALLNLSLPFLVVLIVQRLVSSSQHTSVRIPSSSLERIAKTSLVVSAVCMVAPIVLIQALCSFAEKGSGCGDIAFGLAPLFLVLFPILLISASVLSVLVYIRVGKERRLSPETGDTTLNEPPSLIARVLFLLFIIMVGALYVIQYFYEEHITSDSQFQLSDSHNTNSQGTLQPTQPHTVIRPINHMATKQFRDSDLGILISYSDNVTATTTCVPYSTRGCDPEFVAAFYENGPADSGLIQARVEIYSRTDKYASVLCDMYRDGPTADINGVQFIVGADSLFHETPPSNHHFYNIQRGDSCLSIAYIIVGTEPLDPSKEEARILQDLKNVLSSVTLL